LGFFQIHRRSRNNTFFYFCVINVRRIPLKVPSPSLFIAFVSNYNSSNFTHEQIFFIAYQKLPRLYYHFCSSRLLLPAVLTAPRSATPSHKDNKTLCNCLKAPSILLRHEPSGNSSSTEIYLKFIDQKLHLSYLSHGPKELKHVGCKILSPTLTSIRIHLLIQRVFSQKRFSLFRKNGSR
jgi:hypothetical protein